MHRKYLFLLKRIIFKILIYSGLFVLFHEGRKERESGAKIVRGNQVSRSYREKDPPPPWELHERPPQLSSHVSPNELHSWGVGLKLDVGTTESGGKGSV